VFLFVLVFFGCGVGGDGGAVEDDVPSFDIAGQVSDEPAMDQGSLSARAKVAPLCTLGVSSRGDPNCKVPVASVPAPARVLARLQRGEHVAIEGFVCSVGWSPEAQQYYLTGEVVWCQRVDR
jgi:hypothetical protein